MEDPQIIELFFARSEQAIRELASKYGALCLKVADNILGNRQDAEECVNDAYLGVWNTVPPKRPNPLSSYLCRIVRNIAVNRYHANTAAKRNHNYDVALDELENCFPSARSVEEAFDARETARSIDAFLKTLNPAGRILFVRRYWHADPIPELAALFHTNSHNITVRLARIRKKLKKYLIREGISL